MKFRTLFYLLVALAILVAVGLKFKPKPPGGTAPAPAARPETETAGGDEARTSAQAETDKTAGPLPDADRWAVNALTLALPAGKPLVELARADGIWRLASLYSTPADMDRVSRLLDDLYNAKYEPAPADVAAAPAGAGLGPGQGVEIRLGDKALLTVGGNLDGGDHSRTYVRDSASGGMFIAAADLRGDIGLWDNRDSSLPDGSYWLARDLLGLDVAHLAEVDFDGPGKAATFTRDAEGAWHLAHNGPDANGSKFDKSRFEAWLRDLSRFGVSGAADPALYVELGLSHPAYRLRFITEDGAMASAAGVTAKDGTCYAELSTQPGIPYILPEWRFNLYFRRMTDIFPGAAPGFKMADARFIDLRRDGTNVKFVRGDGGWRAVGVAFPLREGAIEHWLASLANWRPRDFADGAAVPKNAPTVEISLDGDARQYRLGDGSPEIDIVAVAADSGNAFAVTPEQAEAMFPTFDKLFDIDRTEYLRWLGREERPAPRAGDTAPGDEPKVITAPGPAVPPAMDTDTGAAEAPATEGPAAAEAAPAGPVADFLLPEAYPSDIVGLELSRRGGETGKRGFRIQPDTGRAGEWSLSTEAGSIPLDRSAAFELLTAPTTWKGESAAGALADEAFQAGIPELRLTLFLRDGARIDLALAAPDSETVYARDENGRTLRLEAGSVAHWLDKGDRLVRSLDSSADTREETPGTAMKPEETPAREPDVSAGSAESGNNIVE